MLLEITKKRQQDEEEMRKEVQHDNEELMTKMDNLDENNGKIDNKWTN